MFKKITIALATLPLALIGLAAAMNRLAPHLASVQGQPFPYLRERLDLLEKTDRCGVDVDAGDPGLYTAPTTAFADIEPPVCRIRLVMAPAFATGKE